MKWILFIIVTSSYSGDVPASVDHITFNTQAGCEQMKAQLEKQSRGLTKLAAPIIDARCVPVNDAEQVGQ